jgi:uncharacterized protein (DUF488 family)
MRAIFEGHLAEPTAIAALAQAADIARERPAALLCFEAEACDCHRAIVAQELRAVPRCEVVDL